MTAAIIRIKQSLSSLKCYVESRSQRRDGSSQLQHLLPTFMQSTRHAVTLQFSSRSDSHTLNRSGQVTLTTYRRLGAGNREMWDCDSSQQLVHLRTNLFCLSAATLSGYSPWLRRHVLRILHPLKEDGTVILEQPAMLLPAHVLEHTSREILFFFLICLEKHLPCQTDPVFCKLLFISPSLLSWFKLQNYCTAQEQGGVQTLVLLVLYHHTESSCRHHKGVLWSGSERQPPRHLCGDPPAQGEGSPCLFPLCSLCLHVAYTVRCQRVTTQTQAASICWHVCQGLFYMSFLGIGPKSLQVSLMSVAGAFLKGKNTWKLGGAGTLIRWNLCYYLHTLM